MSKTYDEELVLIAEGGATVDDDGNPTPGSTTETAALCRSAGVKRNEFYAAGAEGLKPSVVLTIHTIEYGGQRLARYRGRPYQITRAYGLPPLEEEIELTLSEKVGVI